MIKKIFLLCIFLFNLNAMDLSTKPYFTDKERVIEYILYKSPSELDKILKEYKYDLNKEKLDGKLAIEYALREGCDYQKIKVLLKYNVNLNIPFENDYYYPLHYLLDNDNCKDDDKVYIVNLFLRKNAKIDQKNSLGSTPLHFSAKNLNLKTTQYLLINKADAKIYTKENYPLTHYLVKNITPKNYLQEINFYYILNLLIKYGFHIDMMHNDQTLLTIALESKKNDLAKFLLLNGANPNIKPKNDYNIPLVSALLVDLHQKNLDIIKVLLKFNAHIQDVDKKIPYLGENYPLLILTMMKKNFDTTAFLIINGANVNVSAREQNALYWSYENVDVYNLLKRFGAIE